MWESRRRKFNTIQRSFRPKQKGWPENSKRNKMDRINRFLVALSRIKRPMRKAIENSRTKTISTKITKWHAKIPLRRWLSLSLARSLSVRVKTGAITPLSLSSLLPQSELWGPHTRRGKEVLIYFIIFFLFCECDAPLSASLSLSLSRVTADSSCIIFLQDATLSKWSFIFRQDINGPGTCV